MITNIASFNKFVKSVFTLSYSFLKKTPWQVEKILEARKTLKKAFPKFLILENVTALLSERHKNDFEEWHNVLKEFGYHNHCYKLNAKNFGLPQNRHRLIMISTFVGTGLRRPKWLEKKLNEFFEKHNLNDEKYVQTLRIKNEKLINVLRQNYENPKLLAEALAAQPNDTPSRREIWNDNPKLVDENGKTLDYVSTITTKQDRNPNSGNIYFDPKNNKSKYRFLTPRECTMLMGFSEDDFEKVIQSQFVKFSNHNFFTRDILYHLAGNSIAVKVLEQVFSQVIEINDTILKKQEKT